MFELFNPAVQRGPKHAPEALKPFVAADPLFASFAPGALGIFFALKLIGESWNDLTRRHPDGATEADYGYAFGHWFKMISGFGIGWYGISASVYDYHVAEVGTWAPAVKDEVAGEIAGLLGSQLSFIITAFFVVSALGALMTGGFGRALDTPKAVQQDRKRAMNLERF